MSTPNGYEIRLFAESHPDEVGQKVAGRGGSAVAVVKLRRPLVITKGAALELDVDFYIRAVIDSHGANGRGELT